MYDAIKSSVVHAATLRARQAKWSGVIPGPPVLGMFSFGDPVRLTLSSLYWPTQWTTAPVSKPCIQVSAGAVVEQTKIGSIPWQRTGQGESRRCEFARDTKSFGVGVNLKLGAGEPCAVYRECQPAIIAVAKNRRVQNIDCFVVETFKDRAGKIIVRIDNQRNWAAVWLAIRKRRGIRRRRRPKYQPGKIGLDNEFRAKGRDERSQINMPPIRA